MRRKGFIASATAFAAAAFLRDVTLAAQGDGTAGELSAVVETLFPFDAIGFPRVTSAQLAARIDAIFSLSADPVFTGSLHGFGDVAAFSAGATPLFAAERAFLPAAHIDVLVTRDATSFASLGLPRNARFAELSPRQRASYVRLWARSAFLVRRRFYSSVRTVAFAAFYSMPEAWSAIGYGGPLMHAKEPA
jgi:hypothetical protein